MEMSNDDDIASKASNDGFFTPFSQFPIVTTETPIALPKACCVYPRSSLSCFSLLPKSITSPPKRMLKIILDIAYCLW